MYIWNTNFRNTIPYKAVEGAIKDYQLNLLLNKIIYYGEDKFYSNYTIVQMSCVDDSLATLPTLLS